MIKKECIEKCARIGLGFYICEGDQVIVKASREIFTGKITGVTPIAIMLDNEMIINISKITWIKWISRGCES